MIIGYGRVSTDDQTTALQREALKKARCQEIFEDHMTGATADRPGLNRALARLKAGDILIVWRLDRLGRSLRDLIDLIKLIENKGAELRSLTEHIDTTNAAGRLFFHVTASFAQFERELFKERTMAGIAIAKANGKHCGRKRSLSPRQVAHAKKLLASETVPNVARTFKVSRSTLYRYLSETNS